MVVRSPTPFELGQNGCWSSRGSQLPRVLPFIFSLCCPLNDRKRAAHSFFKIGRLFSPFLFSGPSLALLRLFILLLLLISDNVHPNPGPIFCSVCAGNVTWRGKSGQCCTYSKWVHLRCSQLSLSQIKALGSSHSWSCHLCGNTVTPSSDSSDMYTSTVQSRPTIVSNLLSTICPFCIFSLCLLTTVPCSWLSFYASCFLSPLTSSGFFNGMLQVFKPEALNYFIFCRPIPLILSASRNPIFTHLSLSRFLDSLLCVLIAPTAGLAFSLLTERTLATALSFLSGRAYLFLNFLSPLFLRLIPTLIM